MFLDVATVDAELLRHLQARLRQRLGGAGAARHHSVVLTESEAIRQFGTADAVGRTLSLGAGTGGTDYRVTGVIRDLPSNTSLRARHHLPPRSGRFRRRCRPADKGWGNMNQQHYVKLRPGADAAAINAAFPAWEKRTIAPQIDRRQAVEPGRHPRSQAGADRRRPSRRHPAGALTPRGDPRTLATFASSRC